MDQRLTNLIATLFSADELAALVASARETALRNVHTRLTETFSAALWQQVLDQTVPTPSAPAPSPAPPPVPAPPPDPLDELAMRNELAALREQLAANRTRSSVRVAEPLPVPEPPVVDRTAHTPDLAEADAPTSTILPADGWGYYVYGIMRSGVMPSGAGVIAGTQLEALPCADFTAIISRVPLDELDEATLAERAHDLAWIEGLVRAHQTAQESLLPLGPLVPMRLATIFASRERVAALVYERASELRSTLDRLDQHDEWGVQLFADEAMLASHAAAVSPATADLRAQIQRGGAGAAYMLQRRMERAAVAEAERIADAAAMSIHERLSQVTSAAVQCPLRERASGATERMLLNGAYLVHDHTLTTFIDTVEALSTEFAPLGMRIVRTGPWPAYNFVGTE